MKRIFQFSSLTLLFLAMTCTSSLADDATDNTFDREVAPLLVHRCLDCHHSAAKKGGLGLSNAAGAMAGGESGPAIKSGVPADSLRWQRISSDEMPPKQPLSADEKALLNRRIADGARWDNLCAGGQREPEQRPRPSS